MTLELRTYESVAPSDMPAVTELLSAIVRILTALQYQFLVKEYPLFNAIILTQIVYYP